MEKSGAKGAEGPLSARTEGGLPKGESGNNLPEEPCFVVGIGASAGGQAPLEHLFTVLPADCNLSFVVVMHLPPDGPDLLADLLRRYTPMEVLTAEDGAPLLPNSVHVIPPGACLSVSNGRLNVEMKSGMSALEDYPIDRLFTSLAADFGKEIPEPLRQSVEESLADGVSREFDINLDGRDISFVVSPFPERDYANLYGHDITKRNQAEESLRRAKESWERTFDSVPDLITILDNEHRVLRVNAAMARRLTHRHEECVGRRCYEVIHGTCVPPEFCPHLRTIEDGREHIEELHVDSLGGDFLVTTTPLLDKEGGRIGSVHIARDITERKRMEEALRESEVGLKRAQEIAHLGSWELDLVNNKLSWSDEVYRIFGFQPQEFGATYEAFLEVVHPEDRAAVDAAYAESLCEGKDSYEITHRIVRKSTGDIRIVQEKCEHIRDDSGTITRSMGMVQDITERAQAEEEILRYVDELERFNRATVGRELRMVELKKEVNELRSRLGEGPRYSLDFVEE